MLGELIDAISVNAKNVAKETQKDGSLNQILKLVHSRCRTYILNSYLRLYFPETHRFVNLK